MADKRKGKPLTPARQAARARTNARTRVIPASIFHEVDRAIDLVREAPERAADVCSALEGVFARDGGGPNTE